MTLGENTADNGGLLLAYMAYLQRAKDDHVDVAAKKGGFTGPQRFYIAFAQNYCQATRPEAVRTQVLQDPHSPDQFRVDGVIVNQPGFAEAFSCKKGSPMVPVKQLSRLVGAEQEQPRITRMTTDRRKRYEGSLL